MENKVFYGKVCWFNNKLGYGFISWEKDGVQQDDIFVYHTDINSTGFRTLKKDQKVSYEIGFNKRGQIKAISVSILD